MSLRVLPLWKVERELLQELGDLENIKIFPIEEISEFQYRFFIQEQEAIVAFEECTDLVHNQFIRIPPAFLLYKTDPVYNLGYAVDRYSLEKKMDVTAKVYFQIMATVLEITKKFLKEHENAFLLFFESTLKGKREGQRFEYYVEILLKHLKADYVQTGVSIGEKEGVLFGPYRKWKPKEKEKFLFDPYTGKPL